MFVVLFHHWLTNFFTKFQAELLNQESGAYASDPDDDRESIIDKATTTDDQIGKTLVNIVTDNIRLRKRVNSIIHRTNETDVTNIETSSPAKDKSS